MTKCSLSLKIESRNIGIVNLFKMSSADSIFIQIWKENKKLKYSTRAFVLTFVAALMKILLEVKINGRYRNKATALSISQGYIGFQIDCID